MVQQGYEDWSELCEKFPSETLNDLDLLWVNYSKGHFGFSIQKRMWSGMGGELSQDDYDTWKKFVKLVGWYVANDWRDYNSLPFSTESPTGNLPALYLRRRPNLSGWWVWSFRARSSLGDGNGNGLVGGSGSGVFLFRKSNERLSKGAKVKNQKQ